ncbi:MAG: LPS ABC transporter substrate-binding protein LptA [Rhizobiaceae bacterium]|nr:LPS ABC transporter substrate-binding protein LptA [Rhizobiaceae bacterium]
MIKTQTASISSGAPMIWRALIIVAAVLFGYATPASAQNFGGAFEGMQDNKQPIQIEADRLEVEDKKGTAYFKGNVNVVQGSTILKAGSLRVYYFSGKNGTSPNSKIKKIEAGGGVAVRSKDQNATADSAVFNIQAETVVMKGHVVISQGPNIATGCVLRVDMKTGAGKLEPCKKGGGRVKILLNPGSAPK